jgi:hypothetical protein
MSASAAAVLPLVDPTTSVRVFATMPKLEAAIGTVAPFRLMLFGALTPIGPSGAGTSRDFVITTSRDEDEVWQLAEVTTFRRIEGQRKSTLIDHSPANEVQDDLIRCVRSIYGRISGFLDE